MTADRESKQDLVFGTDGPYSPGLASDPPVTQPSAAVANDATMASIMSGKLRSLNSYQKTGLPHPLLEEAAAHLDRLASHLSALTAERDEAIKISRDNYTLLECAEAELAKAREAAIEECAKLADAHKGSAAKKRRARGPQADNTGLDEIYSEERGEDIAAEMISAAVLALLSATSPDAPPVYGDQVSIRATYNANTSERAPPLSDRAWVRIEGNDHLTECPIAAIEKRSAPQDGWRPIETALREAAKHWTACLDDVHYRPRRSHIEDARNSFAKAADMIAAVLPPPPTAPAEKEEGE